MKSDQRRSRRRVLNVELKATDSEGFGELHFEAADLSSGGAFLKSDLLLEPGDTLSLEFRLPEVPELLRAQARVAWVRRFPRDGEPAGMGVEFLSMAAQDRDHLNGFLGALGPRRSR